MIVMRIRRKLYADRYIPRRNQSVVLLAQGGSKRKDSRTRGGEDAIINERGLKWYMYIVSCAILMHMHRHMRINTVKEVTLGQDVTKSECRRTSDWPAAPIVHAALPMVMLF